MIDYIFSLFGQKPTATLKKSIFGGYVWRTTMPYYSGRINSKNDSFTHTYEEGVTIIGAPYESGYKITVVAYSSTRQFIL
jgi:hypothetical protein